MPLKSRDMTPEQLTLCCRQVEILCVQILDDKERGRWPPPDRDGLLLGLAQSSLRMVRHFKAKEAANGKRSS